MKNKTIYKYLIALAILIVIAVLGSLGYRKIIFETKKKIMIESAEQKGLEVFEYKDEETDTTIFFCYSPLDDLVADDLKEMIVYLAYRKDTENMHFIAYVYDDRKAAVESFRLESNKQASVKERKENLKNGIEHLIASYDTVSNLVTAGKNYRQMGDIDLRPKGVR